MSAAVKIRPPRRIDQISEIARSDSGGALMPERAPAGIRSASDVPAGFIPDDMLGARAFVPCDLSDPLVTPGPRLLEDITTYLETRITPFGAANAIAAVTIAPAAIFSSYRAAAFFLTTIFAALALLGWRPNSAAQSALPAGASLPRAAFPPKQLRRRQWTRSMLAALFGKRATDTWFPRVVVVRNDFGVQAQGAAIGFIVALALVSAGLVL